MIGCHVDDRASRPGRASRLVMTLGATISILAMWLSLPASGALALDGASCLDQPGRAHCERRGATAAVTPEQELAEAFAPIVMLKRQEHPCDSNGEAYLPAPVDIVLDDSDVALRRITGRSRTSNETVKAAPTESDLMNADDSSYFLDFPGNPRRPRCDYERWFRQRMAGHEPVVYANVITAGDRVVIQYWFWYVFNDFNNTHEGDWEMIQVVFDADSVSAALSDQPVEVGYSSHGGGERAGWNDEKLTKEGNHPVVYPGAGSHANKFGSGVYMAWGEDNSGFGCDITTGPSDRIVPTVILAPNDLAAAGPLAELAWHGRWGERQPAFFNGPNSPGIRERWTDPFPWQDGLRTTSLKIPEAVTFGPGPTSVFCSAVSYGSLLVTRWVVYPWFIATLLVVGAVVVLLSWRAGAANLRAAWRVYVADWRHFAVLGAMLIPLGIIANAVQFAFVDYPPGKQMFQMMDASPGSRLAIALTIGGLQDLLGLILIGPAIIAGIREIEAGRRPTLAGSYRLVFARFRQLISGVGRSIGIVALLTLSVVGIPWAIARAVRWLFVSQAVLLDDTAGDRSLRASASVVAGRWWRTAGNAVFFWFVGVAPGPLIGLALLILATPDVRYVNWLSSLIYAVLVPLSVIGMTMLYRNLKRDAPPVPVDAMHMEGASPLPAD